MDALFAPVGDTVNAAVTGSSAALALTGLGQGGGTVRLANIGTQTVFVKFGVAGVTAATTTGMPLLANTVEAFEVGGGVTHVAHIAGNTGSTLYATSGQGR